MTVSTGGTTTVTDYVKPNSKYAPILKAGKKFGLDLAGLFEDEEFTGGLEGLGLVPTVGQKALLKGRGAALSFRAPKEPTRISEFKLEPASTGSSTVAATPAPAPAPAAAQASAPPPLLQAMEEELKTYYGNVGTLTPSDIGNFGIGKKDYEAAIASGYDPKSIKDYLEANIGRVQVGKGLAEQLGIKWQPSPQGSGAFSINTTDYDPSAFGGKNFGPEDINYLATQGISPGDMAKIAQAAASRGAGISSAAAQYLGIPQVAAGAGVPAATGGGGASQDVINQNVKEAFSSNQQVSAATPTASQARSAGYSAGDVGRSYNAASVGGANFGPKDVAALSNAGYSASQISKIASSSGARVTPGAKQAMSQVKSGGSSGRFSALAARASRR
jgi:hypothetical protein